MQMCLLNMPPFQCVYIFSIGPKTSPLRIAYEITIWNWVTWTQRWRRKRCMVLKYGRILIRNKIIFVFWMIMKMTPNMWICFWIRRNTRAIGVNRHTASGTIFIRRIVLIEPAEMRCSRTWTLYHRIWIICAWKRDHFIGYCPDYTPASISICARIICYLKGADLWQIPSGAEMQTNS